MSGGGNTERSPGGSAGCIRERLESSNSLWSVQRWLGRLGFRVVRVSRGTEDMEDSFLELYAECRDFTMTSIERMYALYKAVEYVSDYGIAGDLVECGVWKGGSCMMMALTLLSRGETGRNIYLYDTFRGMCEPGKYDYTVHDGRSGRSRWTVAERDGYNKLYYAPLNEVKANLYSTGYPREHLIFVEGKVEDTIPRVVPEAISLLRLDTDWYESTRHEMVHLYPLLAPGGVLLLDDYGYWAGSRRAVDEYFREIGEPVLLNRIDANGRIGIRQIPPA